MRTITVRKISTRGDTGSPAGRQAYHMRGRTSTPLHSSESALTTPPPLRMPPSTSIDFVFLRRDTSGSEVGTAGKPSSCSSAVVRHDECVGAFGDYALRSSQVCTP